MNPEAYEWEALKGIIQGSKELSEEKQSGIATLEKAKAQAPESPLVRYWAGLAWLQFGREQALSKAIALFSTLDNPFALQALGRAQGLLGASLGELEPFQEANRAFAKAKALSPDDPNLYFEWGQALFLCGAVSGEAIDYTLALEKFDRAKALGAEGDVFWLAYGNTYKALTTLSSDRTPLLRAISCFEQAAEGIQGALAMAEGLSDLYLLSRGEINFDRGYVAFVSASKMGGEEGRVYLAFADHLIRGARFQRRIPLVQEALEKVAAAEMGGGDPLLCSAMQVMAYIQMGQLTDELSYFYEAQNKGEELITKFSSEALSYLRFGQSLTALGDYFGEAAYAEEALSHLQQALTLDSSMPEVHLGFAQLLIELGGDERTPFEEAITHLKEAIKSPHFNADAHHLWGIALAKLAQIRSRSLLAQRAVAHFEQAITACGGASGCEEAWLFHYGCALDLMGTFYDDEEIHSRAIQVLEQLLGGELEESSIQFQLAIAYVHLGEVSCNPEAFEAALAHFGRVAETQPDEESVWDEWGCTLLAYAHLIDDPAHLDEADSLRTEARHKLLTAVKLGSGEALYHLAWLYADVGESQAATLFLEKAAEKGALPPRDELLEEEWLDALRHTEAFRDFLDRI